MECLEPGVVKPEDLVAYSVGEADSRTAAHIEGCSDCAAQAAAYAGIDRVLRSRLFRVDCPTAHTLGELALELLDPDDARAVRLHLVHCPHCRDELTSLVEAFRTDPLADLGRERPWLMRAVARFIPSPALQPAYAVRGVASAAGLTYQAADLTISLTIDRHLGRWSLLGSVLDDAGRELAAGIPVRLAQDESVVAETALDEWGLFAFSALDPGIYELELDLSDRSIAVESIDIGGGQS